MGLVSAMASFKKITLILVFSLSAFLALLVLTRKPLVTFLATTYLRSHNIHASFHLRELTWNEIILDDIEIEKTSRIKNITWRFSPPWKRPWDWSQLDVNIGVLDVDTLMTLTAQFFSSSTGTPESPKDPISAPTPEKALDICQRYNHRSVRILWQDMILQQKKIPLHLVVGRISEEKEAALSIQWKAPDLTEGHFVLDCRDQALFLQGKTFLIDFKDLSFKDTRIRKFYLNAPNSFVKWDRDHNKQVVFAGTIDVDLFIQEKELSLRSSPLVLTAQSFFDQPDQLDLHLISKNLNTTWGKKYITPLLQIKSTLQTSEKKAQGHIDLQHLDIKENNKKNFLHDVNGQANFTMSAKDFSSTLDLWNAKKKLIIQQAQLKGQWESSSYSLMVPPEKARWRLDSAAFQLAPVLSEYLKEVSGTLFAGGTLTYQKDKFDGDVTLRGQKMGLDAGFGSLSGIDFSHRIRSFKNWSSPTRQSLFIKEFTSTLSMQNIQVLYEIKSLDHIRFEQLTFNMDEASITGQPFDLFPRKKTVENLLLAIHHMSLEKIFAIGLQDSVTSDALLDGWIKANSVGARPVLSGQLAATKPGFIQYRTGRKASTKLSVGDGPLDILYNYLDDFQYQTLSLDVSSDKNYQMLLHLQTLGRNPQYLSGKPLKLNIKLEQNLLAAVQSLMLTYDLPDRIKEKLEKAEQ